MDELEVCDAPAIEVSQEEQSYHKIENVSDETLANIVSEGIKYDFTRYILVKPLEIQMVLKPLTAPQPTGEKDENGDDILEMVKTEVETESTFRRGIVLSVPATVKVAGLNGAVELNVGDTIVFPNKRSMDFDLFKDSALVEPFDVVAITKK
jgi:hypothetical protein